MPPLDWCCFAAATFPETPVVVGELWVSEVDIPPSTHLSSEI